MIQFLNKECDPGGGEVIRSCVRLRSRNRSPLQASSTASRLPSYMKRLSPGRVLGDFPSGVSLSIHPMTLDVQPARRLVVNSRQTAMVDEPRVNLSPRPAS